jgi:hypothetical protein
MNETNFKFHFRKVKNTPSAGNVERVLSMFDFDQGSEHRRGVLVEKLVLGGAGFQPLTNQLPAGCRVLFAGIYLETAVVLTTAVKLGIGISGTPIAFYLSGTTMTIGTTDIQPVADTNARQAAAITPRLTTTDTSGVAAGSGTGTVKVVIIYEYCTAIQA